MIDKMNDKVRGETDGIFLMGYKNSMQANGQKDKGA
jgi:hypothetical protein